MTDAEFLQKRYNVKIVIVTEQFSFAPITKITFSDGYIINIKTSGTFIHDHPNEYMNSIEKEIKTYNIVLRTKKLERICDAPEL